MKHKLDRRTKPMDFHGLQFYQCSRCGVWTNHADRDCDGKSGKASRDRIIHAALGDFNAILNRKPEAKE